MSETIIRKMSEVELQEVQWLWKPYIPFGKLVIIQGDPGEGKTTFALRLAAACSSGMALPGMETTEPFNVIYQTAEDGLGDTIKPRLIEAGADENMVLNIIEDTDPLSLSDERIEKAITETGARLMILDPIQGYIGKYYNATELKELLDKTVNDPIHIVIFLAAYYGLRRSEVLGLKWSAIDFENKTVSISHKVVQNDKGIVGMDVMKTKSSYRILPLIPQVEQALLAEREKQEEMKRVMRRGYCKKYTDYICVDAIGELIKPNYVTDHFKVVLKEHGLKSVRFHDLRHSCASLLLANGVPMKMIQDWLGHSDMGTTANIYSHIDSESKKASAMAIGTALG
ncbi:MAG: tyrosine-type recombinase/integrase [Clostridia bacterium]|nr:tyrosine-type recombinase/integrase [Clostridia bacterium]